MKRTQLTSEHIFSPDGNENHLVKKDLFFL